ncbi:YjzD family protein [Bacillus carboniphilus]|uniref:YjzD family protein n=1 Tax=Bacillus carboniphilus TaxID=86663 RepID=A0ABY9JZB0_9BACI|nr:YjzD family protein [Bacillus carboniphilus]WLR42935.1 YjzD family protein [Bacillus carboniphilus]
MRFIVSFFWSFLLFNMGAYIVSSMNGVAYHFSTASIIAIVATVLIFIIGEVLPMDTESKSA